MSEFTYSDALFIAGHNVVKYREFGSYSGNWAAILRDGTVVLGRYGSCSVCDDLKSYLCKIDMYLSSHKPSKEQMLEFLGLYDPVFTKDYCSLFAEEEWNSNDCHRLDWIFENLLALGFVAKKA